MKITRKMLHEDLQPLSVYWPMKVIGFLCTREWTDKIVQKILMAAFKAKVPKTVSIEEKFLPTTDGETTIRVKIYRPKSAMGSDEKLPPMLYTHGGG